MPPSAARAPPRQAMEDQGLAVAAESLYLINLLLVPGIAFAILLWLYFRRRAGASALARCHLDQTVRASIWAAVLLLIANAIVIALGGYREPATWLVVILYFTVCHSTLVLLGMFGLARALAGKPFVYPVIGKRYD